MNGTKQIRVSYLITTRNRAKHLQRTLDNVREFITPEDELIVIDGGSTDETVEILERNRDIVSFCLSEPDKSEAHAFNKGWRRAKGQYLKPITDDDYFYPDAMRKMIETMEAHPEIDALIAGGEIWHVAGGTEERMGSFKLPRYSSPQSVNGFWTNHCGLGLLLRREVFEICGGACSSMVSVDGDLVSRIIQCGLNYRYLDVNLYRWYVHPHSGMNKRAAFAAANREMRWRLSAVDPWWSGAADLPDAEALMTLFLENADEGVHSSAKLLLWQLSSRRPRAARLIGCTATAFCRIITLMKTLSEKWGGANAQHVNLSASRNAGVAEQWRDEIWTSQLW